MADSRFLDMASSLELFASVLRAETALNLDGLLDNYAEMRNRLSIGISQIAREQLGGAPASMSGTLKGIEEQIWLQCSSRIPIEKLKIPGYVGIHAILLEFLLQRLDETVSGERLRYLTADQIHTERRVRELRELGYDIVALKVSGRDAYLLKGSPQDLAAAVRIQSKRLAKQAARRFSTDELSMLKKCASD